MARNLGNNILVTTVTRTGSGTFYTPTIMPKEGLCLSYGWPQGNPRTQEGLRVYLAYKDFEPAEVSDSFQDVADAIYGTRVDGIPEPTVIFDQLPSDLPVPALSPSGDSVGLGLLGKAPESL